jgi:hypothetical protein
MSEQQAEQRSLSTIAREIRRTWVDKDGNSKVYFGAVPYLEAMQYLEGPGDSFGDDDAKSVVMYFLSNATYWRGPDAKRIKAELKAMFNLR